MTTVGRASGSIALALIAVSASCGGGSPTTPGSPYVSHQQNVVTVSFDFRDGLQGWAGEYAAPRWPTTTVGTFESRTLPAPLDTSQRAFYMTGGVGVRLAKRRVSGIPTGRTFSAVLNVEVATNMPTGCFNSIEGIISDVEAHAHVTAAEPLLVSDSSGALRPEWTAPGSVSLGGITTGARCGPSDPGTWVLKNLTGTVGPVRPDDAGRVWLSFMAWDFRLFGTTDGRPFYLTRFSVVLKPNVPTS